jgi:hypothetical protein
MDPSLASMSKNSALIMETFAKSSTKVKGSMEYRVLSSMIKTLTEIHLSYAAESFFSFFESSAADSRPNPTPEKL